MSPFKFYLSCVLVVFGMTLGYQIYGGSFVDVFHWLNQSAANLLLVIFFGVVILVPIAAIILLLVWD